MPSGQQRHPSNPRRVKEAARRPTGRGTCPAGQRPAPGRGTNQTQTHTAHAYCRGDPRADRASSPSFSSAAFSPVSQSVSQSGHPHARGPSCRGGRTHERRADGTGVSRCGSRCPAPRSLAHEPHGCVPPPLDTILSRVQRIVRPAAASECPRGDSPRSRECRLPGR